MAASVEPSAGADSPPVPPVLVASDGAPPAAVGSADVEVSLALLVAPLSLPETGGVPPSAALAGAVASVAGAGSVGAAGSAVSVLGAGSGAVDSVDALVPVGVAVDSGALVGAVTSVVGAGSVMLVVGSVVGVIVASVVALSVVAVDVAVVSVVGTDSVVVALVVLVVVAASVAGGTAGGSPTTVFASLTASAIQLNRISCGAALFNSIVNPLTLLFAKM